MSHVRAEPLKDALWASNARSNRTVSLSTTTRATFRYCTATRGSGIMMIKHQANFLQTT